MKKTHQYILSISFIIFLLIPHFIQKVNLLQGNIKTENRAIAQRPKIDIQHLDKFPKQFDSYYNDNFGLRPLGLKAYNNFSYFFLKKSPAPKKAILGKDGWLFQGRDIDHYRGSKRLSNSELKKLETAFQQREHFLTQNNCKFIFVLIPTKKEIYPEYLPDGYFKYSEKTLSDQFLEMLRKQTKIDIIDLRPTIKNLKKIYPVLFHKMDNHWNDIAAFYACKEITEYLSKLYHARNFHSYEDYNLDTTTYYGGSIARMLGVQDQMTDYRLKLNPKFHSDVKRLPQKYTSPERFPYPGSYERRYKTENDSLPRLMMINDSFGEYFHKFLPEQFSYSIFLFDGWEFKLHPRKVLEEKPDIFILATFEGFIPNILNNLNRIENQIPKKNNQDVLVENFK